MKIKKIELYKSALCPRCMYLSKIVDEVVAQHPHIEVEKIDVLLHPKRMAEAGVKMIPALKSESDVKTWILPKKEEIETFLLS